MSHPFDLIKCLPCNGTGRRNREYRGALILRVCRECSGSGKVLAGDLTGPYVLTLDYSGRAA